MLLFWMNEENEKSNQNVKEEPKTFQALPKIITTKCGDVEYAEYGQGPL